MSKIDDILSKGDVASGHRSRERAKELLNDFKRQLGMPEGVGPGLDHDLEEFLMEAVLGAAWYQKRCGDAKKKVWFYIGVNCLLVIGLPLGLIGIDKLAPAESG